MLKILSLGAGVQSTTVALMSAYGELPKFDRAIFADTGWEPKEVYAHLGRLTETLEAAGIPVSVVSGGNIREDHLRPDPENKSRFIQNPRKHPQYKGKQRTSLPVMVVSPSGGYLYRDDEEDTGGKRGKLKRTCTSTYKIIPVEKEIRRLLGLERGQRWPTEHTVDQYFGISWDETQRMSDPLRPCMRHIYPLVDMKMTRDDCHTWMAEHGWSAPRSACIGCPFHNNEEWRNLRDNYPEEWEDAVFFDEEYRRKQAAGDLAFEGVPYLHFSFTPLKDADLGDAEAQYGEDCSGFCGT